MRGEQKEGDGYAPTIRAPRRRSSSNSSWTRISVTADRLQRVRNTYTAEGLEDVHSVFFRLLGDARPMLAEKFTQLLAIGDGRVDAEPHALKEGGDHLTLLMVGRRRQRHAGPGAAAGPCGRRVQRAVRFSWRAGVESAPR